MASIEGGPAGAAPMSDRRAVEPVQADPVPRAVPLQQPVTKRYAATLRERTVGTTPVQLQLLASSGMPNTSRWANAIRDHRQQLLSGYHLPQRYIEGYYERRILPYQHKQRYARVDNPTLLYRGMFVSADDMATLLDQGFPVSRNTWTAVGGKGVYFSTSQQEALTYVFHNGSEAMEGVGVVFAVRPLPTMQPVPSPTDNPDDSIYKSAQDVPASAIVDVYLWGEWGLERLDDVLARIETGAVTPHEKWTGAFDSLFGRG